MEISHHSNPLEQEVIVSHLDTAVGFSEESHVTVLTQELRVSALCMLQRRLLRAHLAMQSKGQCTVLWSCQKNRTYTGVGIETGGILTELNVTKQCWHTLPAKGVE